MILGWDISHCLFSTCCLQRPIVLSDDNTCSNMNVKFVLTCVMSYGADWHHLGLIHITRGSLTSPVAHWQALQIQAKGFGGDLETDQPFWTCLQVFPYSTHYLPTLPSTSPLYSVPPHSIHCFSTTHDLPTLPSTSPLYPLLLHYPWPPHSTHYYISPLYIASPIYIITSPLYPWPPHSTS